MNWHLNVIVAGFLLVTNLGVHAQGQITVHVVDKASSPTMLGMKPKASSLYVERGTAGKPFRWVKPGGDPCNPKVGCTLDWALGKSGWPKEVQHLLWERVAKTNPTRVTITKGWEGWMTWGKHLPKFERYTRAEFEQVIPTHEWSVAVDGIRYVLIRPYICKNWGGYTRSAERQETFPAPVEVQLVPTPLIVEEPDPGTPIVPGRPPLGPNPGLGGVVCDDDSPF